MLAGDEEVVLLYTVRVSIAGPTEERELQFYLYDTGQEMAVEDSQKPR